VKFQNVENNAAFWSDKKVQSRSETQATAKEALLDYCTNWSISNILQIFNTSAEFALTLQNKNSK